eukprot:CAMPEP_0116825534 /NCGR_PEP_ID=MMETSP0418-20121206/2019_1 /TAXON_ID=1158023 /ORGANISM="Astrosyne radiata, Strain 13vi08-1A" /LENGTH=126 /DNA_ID=CAMNT_0004454053 /DNA_START=374 /DNA_END=751 /DNA_ORIENTATION=-
MTRLGVNWIGLPNRPKVPSDSFRVAILLSMFWVTVNCLVFYLPRSNTGQFSLMQIILFPAFNGLVWFYYLSNVAKLRRRIRDNYTIPEKRCPGYEDTCMSLFCSPLVVMQMSRHTADYGIYPGRCW